MSSAINWKDSIKRSNNNPKLAQDLLDMLSLELPEFKRLISHSLENNNRADLQAHIHKLHGATSYCGVLALQGACRELEKALNENQQEHIFELYGHFKTTLETTKKAIKELLDHKN